MPQPHVVLCVTLILCAQLAHAASQYHLTPIPSLGGSSAFFTPTLPSKINDAGQVTGISTVGGPPQSQFGHAFIYSGGTMNDYGQFGRLNAQGTSINSSGAITVTSTDTQVWNAFIRSPAGAVTPLPTLGGPSAGANGINDSGVAVGWASKSAQQLLTPASWTSGVVTELFPGTGGEANAINNGGAIVGYFSTPAGQRGFLRSSGGGVTELTLGGSAEANGINGFGLVVGSSHLTSSAFSAKHAFLYDGNQVIDLNTLGGSDSTAWDINVAGDIVGESLDTFAASRAFLYTGGQMLDLNNLLDASGAGWTLRAAQSINASGQIVGWGVMPGGGGQLGAFLLTPVPEPSSLLATSLAMLALARRRRGRRP